MTVRRLYAIACDCCGSQAQPGVSVEAARTVAARWGFRPPSRKPTGHLAASLGPEDRCPACIDHDGEHPT